MGTPGCIVAPPSRTVGPYAWEIGHEPGAVPARRGTRMASGLFFALAGCTPPKAHGSAPFFGRTPRPLVLREGERNRRLFQLGAATRRYGVGADSALRAWLEVVNRPLQCRPLAGGRGGQRLRASAKPLRTAGPLQHPCGAPLPEDGGRSTAARDEDALIARALGVVLL